MRKALSILVILAMMLGLLVVTAQATDIPAGTAVKGKPTVDGDIEDAWASVPIYPIERLKDGRDTGLKSQFRAMWQENALYVLIEVDDSTHSFNGGPSVGDGMEVYLDLLNLKTGGFDDDLQAYFAMCADDESYLTYDGSAMGKFSLEEGTTVAMKTTDNKYVYEVEIKLDEFETTFAANQVIGFDIQVNDQVAPDTERSGAYGWSDDVNNAWQGTSLYGNLTLSDGGESGGAAPAKAEPLPTKEGYIITASRGTPVVDGKMDPIWETCEVQEQTRIRNGSDTGTHVKIRFLYDDENLYFLGEVPDASLWTKDLSLASMTYNMDGAEICLSLKNSDATSIDTATDAWVGVTPYGDFYSSQANWLVGSGAGVSGDNEEFDAEFMEVHTSLENDPDNDTANPYYIEAVWHIKAYDGQYAPKAGLKYGFEISYNDNAEYENRTMCIGWSDISDGASTNPKVWGEIFLGGESGGATLPVGTAQSEPTLLWDFNEDEEMSAFMGANSNNAVSFFGERDADGNEYFNFIAGGNDPYISIDMEAEDVSDIVWCKARVKNPGPATAIELFAHTNGRDLTGSECTHINIAADDQWHTYVIYIPDENVKTVNAYKAAQYAITEPYWEGTVEWIRLDPMWQEGNDGSDAGGSMSTGDEINIDYIAFFPTEEAARSFRAELDEAAAVYETPVVANGEPSYGENYAIPRAKAAPTIDGVKDPGEWEGALIRRINQNSVTAAGLPMPDSPPDALFYYLWSEDGLYLFADVTDSTEPTTVHDPGMGSYISGDGIQLNIYPDPETQGSDYGTLYFYSIVVNSEGEASIGEQGLYYGIQAHRGSTGRYCSPDKSHRRHGRHLDRHENPG
ncbi:MAG: hypothetical protein K6A33_10550, partial [Clostridiales bacterium]|nr:hypothetical protein [Clostridiales bacterium]